MRKLFGFFLLTIAVLLGGSCSRRYQELDMVESLVESAPELAIKKLDSLGLTGHPVCHIEPDMRYCMRWLWISKVWMTERFFRK